MIGLQAPLQPQPQAPTPLSPPRMPVPQNGVADGTVPATRFPTSAFYPTPTSGTGTALTPHGMPMAGVYNADPPQQPNEAAGGKGQNVM